VCNREDCRSWKHTDEERNESKARFKGKFNHQLNTHFKQYIANYEGDDDDDDDDDEELDEAFTSLVINVESDPNLMGPIDTTASRAITTSYITDLSELSLDDANSTVIELANRAFSHSITATDATTTSNPILDLDPFSYSTDTTTSRYTSTVFIGIIINTGASKRSTASYRQFQAL
jgi:hypothetical protein